MPPGSEQRAADLAGGLAEWFVSDEKIDRGWLGAGLFGMSTKSSKGKMRLSRRIC